jgi:hypothetical protein
VHAVIARMAAAAAVRRNCGNFDIDTLSSIR